MASKFIRLWVEAEDENGHPFMHPVELQEAQEIINQMSVNAEAKS